MVKEKMGEKVPPNAPTAYVYVVEGERPVRYARCMVCTLLESEKGNAAPLTLKDEGDSTDTTLEEVGARVDHMAVIDVDPPSFLFG